MKLPRLLIVGFLCLALAGCTNNVTLENFARIKPGMSLKEVEAIFDGPGKSYQSIKTWRGKGNRTITIEFDDRGLVVSHTHDGF